MLSPPMKSALAAVSFASATLLLTSCDPSTNTTHRPTPPIGQTGETPSPSPTPLAGATPTPEPTPPGATPTPFPTPAATPSSTIPFGTPVPGKPGYVISPYSNAGYVDVQGIPPNSEVKCPYSGKIFRVP